MTLQDSGGMKHIVFLKLAVGIIGIAGIVIALLVQINGIKDDAQNSGLALQKFMFAAPYNILRSLVVAGYKNDAIHKGGKHNRVRHGHDDPEVRPAGS